MRGVTHSCTFYSSYSAHCIYIKVRVCTTQTVQNHVSKVCFLVSLCKFFLLCSSVCVFFVNIHGDKKVWLEEGVMVFLWRINYAKLPKFWNYCVCTTVIPHIPSAHWGANLFLESANGTRGMSLLHVRLHSGWKSISIFVCATCLLCYYRRVTWGPCRHTVVSTWLGPVGSGIQKPVLLLEAGPPFDGTVVCLQNHEAVTTLCLLVDLILL